MSSEIWCVYVCVCVATSNSISKASSKSEDKVDYIFVTPFIRCIP